MKKGLYDEGVREFYNARVYGTLAHIKLAVEFLPADEKEKNELQKLLSHLRQIEAILDDLSDIDEDRKKGIYTPAILSVSHTYNYLNYLVKVHKRIKDYARHLLSTYYSNIVGARLQKTL